MVRKQAQTKADPAGLRGRGWRTALTLTIFIGVVVALVAFSGWQKTWDALRQIPPSVIAALFALAGLHYLIRAWRWHLIVNADGLAVSWTRNALYFFGGFALTATPGRVGELVRLRWLARETGRGFARLLPVAIADRGIELGAMIGLILLALAGASLGSALVFWLIAVATLLVWLVCAPRQLSALIGLAWRASGRIAPRIFGKLRRMVGEMTPYMRAGVLVPTLAIGIAGWACEGLAFWLLLQALGADVALPAATAIFLIAVLSGALSGLPGGLGGTEATIIALLLLQGVPTETSIIATAVIRISTLWFAVLIGFIVFPIAQMRSPAPLES